MAGKHSVSRKPNASSHTGDVRQSNRLLSSVTEFINAVTFSNISYYLQHLNQKYYIVNLSVLLLYPIARLMNVIPKSSNETSAFVYSLFIVLIRSAKSGFQIDKVLTTLIFIYKLTIIYILFNLQYLIPWHYLIAFIIINIVVFCVFPQPTFENIQSKVEFLNQISLQDKLQDSIKKSSSTTDSADNSNNNNDNYWLIEYYTLWSSPCTYLSPIFASLSIEYPNIQFGKVDVGRWKRLALDYHLDDSISSKQIPTFILFKNGKEMMRLPYRTQEYQVPYDSQRVITEPITFKPKPTDISSSVLKSYFNLDKINYTLNNQNQNNQKKNNNNQNNNNVKKNQ